MDCSSQKHATFSPFSRNECDSKEKTFSVFPEMMTNVKDIRSNIHFCLELSGNT